MPFNRLTEWDPVTESGGEAWWLLPARINAIADYLEGLITALTWTFLQLADTPGSYIGEQGKVLAVNSGETALEFVVQRGTNYQKHTVTAGEATSGVIGLTGGKTYTPGDNSLMAFVQGQLQTVGDDYTETSSVAITFVSGRLTTGDTIILRW